MTRRRDDAVEERRRRSASDVCVGLLFTTGMMMLFCALPEGILLMLQGRYVMHLSMWDAMVQAVIITAAIAAVGSVCLGAGIIMDKRRRRSA